MGLTSSRVETVSPETALLAVLADGVVGDAQLVLVGFNWTYVEGPAGAGLCHTPTRGSAGCQSLEGAGTYSGRPLAELAARANSDNPLESALGFAAINAHHNRYDLPSDDKNGLDLLDPKEPSVVVGHFPGINEKLPAAKVIEREPQPGDFPESAAADLLPRATQVAITSSAIANGTLGALLTLVRPEAFCVLIGPSTPCCPGLFARGADALSGLIVVDRDGVRRAIAEGGAVRALRPFTKMVTLRP
jgi:uncharacterized protein (DUF4213/DUF364 family)